MAVQPSTSATARRVAWNAFWTSRLVVMFSGVLAVLAFGRAPDTAGFDPAGLTAPFGYFGNLLAAPFARWDSVWYLAIAQGGYGHQVARTAFFPLYPLMLRGLGVVIGSDLIAGVLISLAAFGIALVLLYELVCLELDSERARVTVMLVAFCPMAYFFSAVYSESVYLALSVGCILAARRGRWAWAGLLGGIAAASRNSGLVLIVPVVLLFLYGPRDDQHWKRSPGNRPRGETEPETRSGDYLGGDSSGRRSLRDRLHWLLPRYALTPQIAWALLIPVGLGAYVGWLALKTGNGLAPFHAQQVWFRHFAGPFGGVWDGAVAAWDGLRQLLHGPPPPIYFEKAGGNALTVAGQNLMLFAFLGLGVIGAIGVLRRLPIAYGGYVLASLALPLSYPVSPQPLASLPRYEVVLFPLFMWGSDLIIRRRITAQAVAALAVLLGLFTAEFATWRFVA
jgi:Mannosyltransferase (PIG-V)